MRRALLLLSVLAAIPLVSGAAQDDQRRIRRNPDVITAEEIAQRADVQNALDAVQRLRATWLRTRSPGTPIRGPAPIAVYVDGIRMGGVDVLRNYPASNVTEIRRLSAPDATTRYGTGHESGAIIVTTVKR